MALKFRIKGTDQILIPRVTDEGTIVLWPKGEQGRYIDDKFSDFDGREYGDELHDSFNVPELEISADGVIWWTIASPDGSSMQIIRPDDYDQA